MPLLQYLEPLRSETSSARISSTSELSRWSGSRRGRPRPPNRATQGAPRRRGDAPGAANAGVRGGRCDEVPNRSVPARLASAVRSAVDRRPLVGARGSRSLSVASARDDHASAPARRASSLRRLDRLDVDPLRAITHAMTEFEFHISPVLSSSRPHTGVGTRGTTSSTRLARCSSSLSRLGLSTASATSGMWPPRQSRIS